MNVLCMDGRSVGAEVAWDLVQTFLAAGFSRVERHLRRLGKAARLEARARSQFPTSRDAVFA
jgi:ribose 5-phosphate isomerase B